MAFSLSVRKARLLAMGQGERVIDIQPEPVGGSLKLRDIEPWGLRMLLV
jgi:hypothetical protein